LKASSILGKELTNDLRIQNVDSLKANYLHHVEKALSSVSHPCAREVLFDVSTHLDRRFEELPPEKRSWENLQAIITEMGPATDYAELLQPDSCSGRHALKQPYLLWLGLARPIDTYLLY